MQLETIGKLALSWLATASLVFFYGFVGEKSSSEQTEADKDLETENSN